MTRTTAYPVMAQFLDRWSPRAFDGSEILDSHLMSIFEAARWAPSSSNIQPWRFIYTKREDAKWTEVIDFLMPGNITWAQNASALVFIGSQSDTTASSGEVRPNGTHAFDTGAAWMSMALQALHMGYQTHAMAGVFFHKAHQTLGLAENIRLHAAVAIGKQADIAVLPENLQKREKPSDRNAIEQFTKRL